MLCNGPLPADIRRPQQISDLFLPTAPDSSSASTSQAADAPSAGMFVNARTGFPVQVTANNNLGGRVVSNSADRFTLETQDGNRFEHVRTAPVTLNVSQLGEFVGTYASEETGATYLVAAEDGQLVLRISRWPEVAMKLRPSYKDAFVTTGALIRFRRNSDGRITEMSWGDGRMRDLRAPRVE